MAPYTFVATWLLQSTLLGGVALALPAICRLRQPRMLTFWWFQATVSVVLVPLLPLLIPRRPPLPTPVTSFVDATTAAFEPTLPAGVGLSPLTWILAVWGLGVLVRTASLRIGYRRLSELAERGVVVERDRALDLARDLTPSPRLPQLAASRVPVMAVAEAGPCAFGGLRPRILVPLALAERPEDERVAVYLHELAHVARSDVGNAMADEVWRAIFWWQPAVWWLLARLRLAREFEVDAVVVERTGRVRPYVDALMWCSTLRPALLPSTHVGSRRHALVQRVAVMCKGAEMTRLRRLITGSVMVVTFGGVTGLVAVLSPLRTASATARQGGLQADQPGPLERAAVLPTLDAPAPRRTTAVTPAWPEGESGYLLRVHIVIDAAGQVAEARVVGVPAPDALPSTPRLASAVEAALDAVRQWQFEAPVVAPMLLATNVAVGEPRRVSTPLRRAASGPAPLRVGGGIAPPRKILDVKPEYPQVAFDAKVQGVVIIECTLDTEGIVTDTRVLRSIPLLDQAALDAVRQWRYTPTWLNGEAVPVIVTVTVNFTLSR